MILDEKLKQSIKRAVHKVHSQIHEQNLNKIKMSYFYPQEIIIKEKKEKKVIIPWHKLNDKEKLDQLKIRFDSFVTKKEDCWDWNGPKHKSGYGNLCYLSKNIAAHRISWIIHKGIIPEEIFVLHKCDNPPCTNPDHLFLGTYEDNMRDMVEKGRSHWQKKRKQNKTINFLEAI